MKRISLVLTCCMCLVAALHLSAQTADTAASSEKYEEADPQGLRLDYRASLKQLQMDASGHIVKIDYTITKFAVGAVDIELTTNRVDIDPDDQKFGMILTKNFGTFRLTFDGGGSASLWLKPSQKKNLLNLLK